MIDTLAAKNAGFTAEQIEVLKQVDASSVTKDYLDAKLDAKINPLDVQIKIGLAIGIAILVKLFVP
jgi:hypothetical protein